MKRIVFVSGWAHSADAGACLCGHLSRVSGLPCDRIAPADLIGNCAQPIARSMYRNRLLARLSASHDTQWIGVGWSLGAMIILEASLAAGSPLRAIVGLGTTSCFCSRHDYPAGIPAQRVNAMLEMLKKKPSAVLRKFFRDVHHPQLVAEDPLNDLVTRALRFSPQTLAHGLSYLVETDLRSACRNLRAPAIFLHGALDRIVPPDAARFCAENIARSALHVRPGDGHQLLDSPAIGDTIGDFLAQREVL
ncbi:MAG: alpha/beta fold hydrolase [Pirellulaceae bacterium]